MQISHQLIQQAQAGDQRALAEVIESAYGSIWGFTHKYFASRQLQGANLAEEATQRSFLALQKHISSLKEPAAFRSWLYRIATNCCREEERRHRRRKVWPSSWLSASEVPQEQAQPAQTNPIDSMTHAEISDRIKLALERLPENQRIVIILKEYEGLKFREIAEILELSENTVKSRLYYGLKALRKEASLQQAHQLLKG